VKDENGDLLADSHNILNRWKNYFSQLLNVHNVSDVRQIEVHMAEPLVPGPSHLEVEIAIAMLKKYKSPRSNSRRTYLSRRQNIAIHKLINSVWNKEELLDPWKESIIVPVHKNGDKTDCNNYCGISLLSVLYEILSNILFSRVSPHIGEIIGDHQCGFRRNRSTQLLIRFSAFVRYWRKNGSTKKKETDWKSLECFGTPWVKLYPRFQSVLECSSINITLPDWFWNDP
jgi:hypothetical protein